VTTRTKAVIPVHLFGHPAEMTSLMEIANRHDVALIEDAAQAIGACCDGSRIGSFGLAGCLSFYPTKNLGAYGDAGMVVTNDPAIAAQVDLLRRQGSRAKYYADVLGFNSRLDSIQAAILDVKLSYLDGWTDGRRRIAGEYNRLLAGLPIEVPVEKAYAKHVYHQYTIQTDRRDELAAHLKAQGIGTMVYYPVPLHRQKLYAGDDYRSLPVAERAAERVLSLPIYPELTNVDQQEISAAIRAFFA
jgi:dTDP-4-amino-4,6-dideoxygalactose transaminase